MKAKGRLLARERNGEPMQARPVGNGKLRTRISREFAALLDALQFQGARTEALDGLDFVEWESLLAICDRAHLTLTLAQMPSGGCPEWVRARLEKNLADNARRSRRIQEQYSEVAHALRAAGVPHVVIKGFTLAPEYVEEARFRMQNDMDMYCPREFTGAAIKALQSIGYTPWADHNARISDHVPPMLRAGGAWKGNMYDPDLAIGIEIHHCLWNEKLTSIPMPEIQSFWHRRIERRNGSFQFSALHPVDQLAYFALHLLRDVFTGDRIAHHGYELAAFLNRRADDDAFWEKWGEAHSPRLRALQAVAFLMAHAWFAPRLPDAVRAEIQALPLQPRRWVDRLGGCPLEASFRRTKAGRILQFLLAESGDAKARVAWRGLFPGRLQLPRGAALRVRYGRLDLTPRENRTLDTLAFLAFRLGTNLRSTAAMVRLGMQLCLPRRLRLSRRGPQSVEEPSNA